MTEKRPLTPEEARANLESEADRLGITVDQLIDILIGGAMDALEAVIAQPLREQEREVGEE